MGLSKLSIAERPPAPAQERMSVAEPKTGSDGVTYAGRTFRPTLHRGWVWCSSCGVGTAAEEIRQHRCGGGAK